MTYWYFNSCKVVEHCWLEISSQKPYMQVIEIERAVINDQYD